MADPDLPRRRGRPPLDPTRRLCVKVTVRLEVKDYDAVYAAARLHRSSIAALLRKTLRRHGKL